MIGGSLTVVLSEAAQGLYASARAHKRAEAQHRKEARRLMRQLDQLRADCEARGIQLHIDTAEEAQSHGREPARPLDDR